MLKRSITALAVALTFSASSMAGVSVIVNKANTADIKVEDVKRIFLGKASQFPNGQEAVPINLEMSVSSRSEFDSSVLGRSSSQVTSYWSKLVFTGKGTPPKEVSSETDVLELVKNNQNIIAYIDSDKVSGDVRVIANQ